MSEVQIGNAGMNTTRLVALAKQGRNPLGQKCTRKMVRKGTKAGRIACCRPRCNRLATLKIREHVRASVVNPLAYVCEVCAQLGQHHTILERHAEGYIASTSSTYDGGVWVSQTIVKWEV